MRLFKYTLFFTEMQYLLIRKNCFMHIGCEIVQGGMANRPFHSLASIESKCLVDERMILFRHVVESPGPSCIFGKDRAIRQVSRGATGVQYKRDGVVERITRCGLHGFNERILKSAFWYSGKGLRDRFAVQTDAMLMKHREIESEIRVAQDALIPVFPGAIVQSLLIVLSPCFTIVKIIGQGMLEREDFLLNQERDVERAWHLRDTQEEFNTPTLSLHIHPLEGQHDHIDIAAGWIETA